MKKTHNYSNLAQSQIVFYLNEHPLVSDNGTQYEENPFNHHGEMHGGRLGRQTDRWNDRLDPFLYSPIPHNNPGIGKS